MAKDPAARWPTAAAMAARRPAGRRVADHGGQPARRSGAPVRPTPAAAAERRRRSRPRRPRPAIDRPHSARPGPPGPVRGRPAAVPAGAAPRTRVVRPAVRHPCRRRTSRQYRHPSAPPMQQHRPCSRRPERSGGRQVLIVLAVVLGAAGPALCRGHFVPAEPGRHERSERHRRAGHGCSTGVVDEVTPMASYRRDDGRPRTVGATDHDERRTTDAMTAQARLLGGRYQVGELLGYGGMAEVHRGRDLRLGRDVAIKMLRTDLARDADLPDAVPARGAERRRRSTTRRSSPSTTPARRSRRPARRCRSSSWSSSTAAPSRRCSPPRAGSMPRRALEITADICAALEFSHRHGIIHRDIKPGNVMLTQNGQVKVMDFGIARALASGATTMTQTSAVIGTAQYLSPEQARGEAVDARSDVYAAGCVLFELLVRAPAVRRRQPGQRGLPARPGGPAGAERHQPRGHAATSTRSCSRRWRRTRSTATRAPARCAPTCCAPPPAARSWPRR